jgi:DNA-binding winged helix-turn-helix (wHTH) protein/tetratricopeptide (TPR) repeat protein
MLMESNSLQFGEFTLDRRLRELRRGNAVLSIPGKAFDLLAYMVANPGRPLTKTELLDAVWPETSVEEANLSQNVFLLRKVLGSGSDGPIKTLAGRGYQFAAEVREIEAASKPFYGQRLEDAQSVTMEATQTRVVVRHEVEEETSSHAGWRWVVAVVVLAAFGLQGWVGRQRWLDRTGGAPVQVVLAPMEGSTGDPVLDKALVQALRMDLAQSPWVTLVPGTTMEATLTQMMRKPEDAMTLAVAREVCERTNSQAVLSGNIARVGQHFLITEEASNCVDGSVIGQSKYEAQKAEELPHAIDRLAATLRQKLGESRRSIARFSTPLFESNTPSLEALKALTQGIEIDRRGDAVQAITFFKMATAADPNFAWAYYSLATSYSNAGDYAASREASAKAYSLRAAAGKSQAFAITALYNILVTQDLYESLRIYREWTSLYPNSALAWNGLDFVQANLGRFADAVVSDRRALALAPHNQNYLGEMAFGQMQSGDFKGAKKTLDQAIALNLDGNLLRVRYLQLAYLLQDDSLLRAQRQWSEAHPGNAMVLVVEAEIAMAEGRFSDARKLVARFNQLYREQGVEGAGEQYTKAIALEMMEAGELTEGKRLFSTSPANPEEGAEVLGLAYAGNVSAAQSAIRTMRERYPKGTYWNLCWGPMVEAVIALQQNRPKDAAAALETARPLDAREISISWVRGNSYLAAGQPVLAEADYRSVITHPERDPTEPTIPLSWLGLGEALAAQGKKQEAIAAYRHFFTLWAHADPDAKYLKQAKQDFATLQTSR